MSGFEADYFLVSLKPHEGADGVNKAFSTLSRELSPADYNAAIDALENAIVSEAKRALKADGLAKTRELSLELIPKTSLSEAQMFAQVLLNIYKVKGNNAAPLIKAFARAAEKLTDEEYNTSRGIMNARLAAIESLTEEKTALRRNPFHDLPFPEIDNIKAVFERAAEADTGAARPLFIAMRDKFNQAVDDTLRFSVREPDAGYEDLLAAVIPVMKDLEGTINTLQLIAEKDKRVADTMKDLRGGLEAEVTSMVKSAETPRSPRGPG